VVENAGVKVAEKCIDCFRTLDLSFLLFAALSCLFVDVAEQLDLIFAFLGMSVYTHFAYQTCSCLVAKL